MNDNSSWSGGRHGLPREYQEVGRPAVSSFAPAGFLPTRNTPLEVALGELATGERGTCWGHFGVSDGALDAGRAECLRVGVDPADEAAVVALAAAREAERQAARAAARAAELAGMELARRLQVAAEAADAAARRLALVQARLVEEADGCPDAHEWLRGEVRTDGHGVTYLHRKPQAAPEEIDAAMSAFGGAVPSDADGRPACKDAYERALWGFIARLAAMLPDGFPCLPGQAQGVGVPTDPLFRTPALALERAKLGKWKGAWLWCCHYREVVAGYAQLSRRGKGELVQEGYQPIPDTLWARAERVAALR